MLQKGPHCKGCVLEKMGRGFALTDGKGTNGVLMVAEALGKEEAEVGRPMVGGAGRTLNRLLERSVKPSLGQRDDYLIANVVNCQPPKNELTQTPWEDAAIAHCSPYLEKIISDFKPKAIVALGAQALYWFTELWGIEKPPHRGYVHETKYGPVIGTYHPSFIQRGNVPEQKVWQLDVAKALWVAQHGVASLKKEKFYTTHPTLMDFLAFKNSYLDAYEKDPENVLLSFDIETPRDDEEGKDERWETKIEETASYTTILRISFSFKPFHAISVPWCEPYLSTIRTLLGLPFGKVVWNRHFDVPRVTFHQCPVGGPVFDGMDAFHFLEPSLRMGLKYVAPFYCPDMEAWFLYSNSKPEYYNAADADVALRCVLAMKKRLEDQGRWKVFYDHFVRLGLVLDGVTKYGTGVDRELRLRERLKLEEELVKHLEELQPLIPQSVKPKKVYKKTKEQLEKMGLMKEGEEWVLVRQELTDKERESANKKFLKQEEKRKRDEEKRLLKAQRKLEREEKKRIKSATSAQKRPRKSSSKSSPPQPNS